MSFPPSNGRPPLYFVRRDPAWCRATGKMRYGSKVEAMMTLRETAAKAHHGQVNRAEERTYECRLCLDSDGKPGWHLTSKTFRPKG